MSLLVSLQLTARVPQLQLFHGGEDDATARPTTSHDDIFISSQYFPYNLVGWSHLGIVS